MNLIETLLAAGWIFYDVCNDYSLDPCAEIPDLNGYEVAVVNPGGSGSGLNFYDLEFEELHYTLRPPGLGGTFI